MREEPSFVERTVHVALGDSPLERRLVRPRTAALQDAEELAAESSLIICNMLYRYHVRWVAHAARKYRVPYWMVVHGALDPYVFTYRGWQKKIWMALIGRRALAGADRVLFITERERQKATAYYAGDNTAVIHLPVALPDVEKKRGAALAARERLGLRPDTRLLLFLGRLEKMKRPLETLQAFAAAAVPNVTLVVAGMTETYSPAELAEAAHALGLPNVMVPGPVYGAEKQELFFAADGYISLSWRENFGYTAAEALAAATPVILSPGHDLGPLLSDVSCGWVLPDFSREAAVEAIRAFATTPREALARMGANGREWAERTLAFEGFKDNLRRELGAALARHREQQAN